MRSRHLLGTAILVGIVMTSLSGCGDSTRVDLAPAPPVQETPRKELPKDRKGGGSGLMQRNPGGNT